MIYRLCQECLPVNKKYESDRLILVGRYDIIIIFITNIIKYCFFYFIL